MNIIIEDAKDYSKKSVNELKNYFEMEYSNIESSFNHWYRVYEQPLIIKEYEEKNKAKIFSLGFDLFKKILTDLHLEKIEDYSDYYKLMSNDLWLETIDIDSTIIYLIFKAEKYFYIFSYREGNTGSSQNIYRLVNTEENELKLNKIFMDYSL